jgi:hypothetical protein
VTGGDDAWRENSGASRSKYLQTAEAEFLDEIQTNILRVTVRFLFLPTPATSYRFCCALVYTVKEKGGKPDSKTTPPSLWFNKSIQKSPV